MENLKKVVKSDIAALNRSNRTFRDIYQVAFSHKDHVAVEYLENYERKQITYRELGERIDAFARQLSRQLPQLTGQLTGGYVAIDLPTGPEFIVAFWAVLQSGNKPYLVNSFYPLALRHQLLALLNIKVVIADVGASGASGAGGANGAGGAYADFVTISVRATQEGVPQGKDGRPQGDHGNTRGDHGNTPRDTPRDTTGTWGNEIAISSSLTGLEAKICVFDGASVAAQIENTTGILRRNKWLMLCYNRRIKVAAILPFFHIFGLVVSYLWFAFFGRTIVFPQSLSPDAVRSAIQLHQVTHVFAPPVLYHKLHKGIVNALAQEGDKRKKRFHTALKLAFAVQNIVPYWGIRLSRTLFREIIGATFGKSVRFMITGGSFTDKDALRLINNIGYPLFNGYGTTETSITSVELRKRIAHRVSGSIGIPFDSVAYSLSDGQTLAISGDSICKKEITSGGEQTGLSCVQTDDIVRVMEGQYYIAGRKSDVFVGENGENISPDMIQNALHVNNAIRFCVLELEGRLSLVLEYHKRLPDIVIRREAGRLKQELHIVPHGLAIRDIFFTRDKIASENAVKISRALLRKKIADGEVRLEKAAGFEKNGEAPSATPSRDDAGMALIKQMFQKALDLNTDLNADTDTDADTDADIDADAHFFFDLGGDSLSYFTLIRELDAILNVQINLEKKNNLYTVADIYKYLTEMGYF